MSIIFQAKVSNICWFQLPKCEDFHCFSVSFMKLNEESLGFGLINDENNLVALTQKSIICQVLSKPLGKFAVAPLSSLHHHMDKHTGPPLYGVPCPDRIKWGGDTRTPIFSWTRDRLLAESSVTVINVIFLNDSRCYLSWEDCLPYW